MKEQNLKNHARIVIGYHVISFVAILALLIGSFINLAHSAKENLYSASLICLIAVILALFFVFIRTFALKAQDRAIRAEENLRHFILTGKPLSNKLTINQIIALRFASDAEYLDLVTKAIEQNLAPKQIKESIKNWRADYHRA
jgi:fatty acid desaturase